MKSVKLMIKDSNGNIETIKYIDKDSLDEMVFYDEWNEEEIDIALDVLSECAPAFFASEKDGKLHGYDFELIEQ